MRAGGWGLAATMGLCMLAGCGSSDEDDPEPTGCALPGVLLAGERQFWGSAADQRYLYVGDSSGRLNRIRLADKRTDPIAQLATDLIVYDCTLDGGTLYLIASRRQNPETGGGGRLLSVPVAGGAVTELATGLDLPNSLVADATHLYWLTIGTEEPGRGFRTDGKLQRRAKAGGAVETLLTGLSTPLEMALDATDVYIAASGNGSTPGPTGVLRVSKAGGAAISLSGVAANKLALDGNSVYFSTRQQGGAVLRVPKTGGAIDRTYATGLPSPSALTLSGSTLYFVADSDGSGSVQAVDIAGGAPRLVADGLNAPTSLTVTSCGLAASLDREVRLLPGN